MSAYNKGDVLETVLSSIFNTNLKNNNFELIVVDDGSSDNTRQVCSKFPIIYAYLDRPYYCNPAKARNLGYSLATGNIIVSQSSEIIHHTENSLNLLSDIKSGEFNIATVLNVNKDYTLCYNPAPVFTGISNQRPFFFLGALRREDVSKVGGDSEDFVEPSFDDDWFAECLIKGAKLKPKYLESVIGLHIDHPRPVNLVQSHMKNEKIFKAKCLRGNYFNNGLIPYEEARKLVIQL